jgi:hypothetical protein
MTTIAQLLPQKAWWQWGKLHGKLNVVLLPLCALTGLHPVIGALLIHFTVDFTAQSTETAIHKGDRGWHLLVHAIYAGGLPLAIAGLLYGNPALALVGSAVGALSHWLIDYTRKFGVENELLGAALDQMAHAVIITLLCVAL